MITLAHLLQQESARLHKAGVDAPRRSAEILACHCFGWDRVGLVLHADAVLTDSQITSLCTLTARRAKGEPIAYLLGNKEFYGRKFTVTQDTLIPRPETEHLIDCALHLLPASPLIFADMGTGSGCIAITLAAERTQWHGCMLDISSKALQVATHNAHTLGVAPHLLALRADMGTAPFLANSIDLCISNPPYIAPSEKIQLSQEILTYEPGNALFSPHHGLHHLKALAEQAALFLRPGGLLLMEHGSSQGDSVYRLLASMPCWKSIKIHKDYAGLDRFCQAYKKF